MTTLSIIACLLSPVGAQCIQVKDVLASQAACEAKARTVEAELRSRQAIVVGVLAVCLTEV